jgi:hypothetical protein
MEGKMNYQILMTIAMFVMAVGVLIIALFRKKQPRLSTRYWDFISIGAILFGGLALTNLLASAANMKWELIDTTTKLLLIVFPTFFIIWFVVYLVLFFGKGGSNSRVNDDERTELANTKSARNALLATNVALFAYLLGSETLARSALIVVLFSGFVVYGVSIIFYYYWKA